jgi:hypothetical protein
VVNRKIGARPIMVSVQAMMAAGSHPQRAEAEDQEHDAEEGKADLGRASRKQSCDRDVAADLET